MKRLKIIMVLFGISILLISCSSKEVVEKFPYGSYSYRSYDIVGNLVGDGSFTIVKLDSVTVEGNWSIRNVHKCATCGTQFGGGYLTGEIKNDSVYINLNPDSPENYTELIGKIDDGSITGNWQWLRPILYSNRGTFEATKL